MRTIRLAFVYCCVGGLLMAQDQKLLEWMNGIAQQQLAKRSEAIAAIQTKEQAAERQRKVRARILELLGGLPDYDGPLNPKVTGTVDRGSYVIENVLLESLPQYFITANLYRPTGGGKHPGVLLPLGHWEEGKLAAQHLAANLALNGFVVLAYDPMGQGERQQGYDRRTGKALFPGGVNQHLMAGAQSLLVGQSFARYRIWDAKRALDYLISRPEVDGERIGCTGCSGGGTVTTYISALDSRIKVAAPACYMQSFKVLFPGPVGDAEQSLPEFLSSGLDQTDYVELFAPKPWLITSTEQDFFTPKGAQVVYDEAKRWYQIWGAPDKVKWVVGPGGHGTPKLVREAIYDWMTKWLKNGRGDTADQSINYATDTALRVTERNQVDGRDLFEIIRETPRKPRTYADLLSMVRGVVGTIGEPVVKVVTQTSGPDLTMQTLVLSSEGEPDLNATLLIPRTVGPAPAVVSVETGKDLSQIARDTARSGTLVLAVWPRGTPSPDSRPYLGDWLANTRAMMIGRNLPMLRAGDLIRGVRLLSARADVDGGRIGILGSEAGGVWAMLAAAADEHIRHVWLHRTPYSLLPAMNTPVHTNLYDVVIPGFFNQWDLEDLAAALKRPVTWTDPTDWNRNVVKLDGDFQYTASDGNAVPFTIPKF